MSAMEVDPDMGSGATKTDIDALKKKLAAGEQRITELESRLNCANVNSKNLDSLSQSDLKKCCLELDASNQALKEKLEKLTLEHNAQVEQLQHKMQLVLEDKDRQIGRAKALGKEGEKDHLANKTDEGKGNIRMAISAETNQKVMDMKKLPKVPKSKEDRSFLQTALESNQFFRKLKTEQLGKIIDCMEKKKLKAGVEIIKEGTDGTYLYIIETGQVGISTSTAGEVATIQEGKIFGELALLYNCRRTASAKTKSDCTVFQLDRRYFQTIVQSTGAERDAVKFDMLKAVPKLKDLSQGKLKKICDCLEEEKFEDGQCIIKQGTNGDSFYIISEGNVKVTKNEGGGKEAEVCKLDKGKFFGELALQSEDKRAANVYAIGDTKCYSLDRHAFINLIGRLDEQSKTDSGSAVAEETEPAADAPAKITGGLEKASISDCRVLKSLGQGGFGDVKLVYFKGAQFEQKPYALKCVQKCRIVQYGQQRHIMDEKNILFQMRSPFVLNLHHTFKDSKQVYLLTDAYLGGDLWRLLHARGPFPDTVARFYIACVVEAFAYLHQRGIVYRDLKPENLMLDINGYLRLVDLGFAKRVPIGNKTWTFCGTPEYIPPEVIANTGHTLSADYWSLGILVYELLTRKTPFRAKDDLTIYENILRGIHSVQFSYRVSRKAEMLIKSLCRQEPSERLGYQKGGVNDIRKHKWFGGFDWDGFHAQRVPAPILPDVRDPMELADKAGLLDPMTHIPEETSGWDATF
jgi:cGMP-dependent protein kinase